MTDASLEVARRLVAEQFPAWAALPLTAAEPQGHDNRTYRLGPDLTVRLPSHERYVAGVAKEDRVLPRLAPLLPLPVPAPVATGRPTAYYPHPWSVRRWLPGTTLTTADPERLARDLAGFLRALRSAPTVDGPVAGRHCFYRGCHPSAYGDQVQEALDRLGTRVDGGACRDCWDRAIRTVWDADPVWFHGDIAAGNLLTTDGRLSAVIDFGTCGVGDPACDLVIAWTWFDAPGRATFRDEVGCGDDEWERARAWALWKALITDDLRTVSATLTA